ncbi:MAG: DNA-binding MarR family transcriptional regulator [Desulforhopalus sp.]|jgi:DNA-binding MarR family transcriptional regulator
MEKVCDDELLLHMISRTAQVMRSFADQWLKKYDLTMEQLKLLKWLDLEQGQTQSKLCVVSAKSAANITRLLDRLENKKYVIRKKNPEDRRASLVFLTHEGLRIREEVREGFDGMRSELLQDIDASKREQVIEVLSTIKNRIESVSEHKG